MRRKGKIKIHRDLLKREEDLIVANAVFAKFTPMYIEDNPFNGSLIYWGYCNDFSELNEGEELPFYEVIIATCDNKFDVNFIKYEL